MKLDKCPYCGNEQNEKFTYCQSCSEDMNPSIKKYVELNSFQQFLRAHPYESEFLGALSFVFIIFFPSIYVFILWIIVDMSLAAYTARLRCRSMAWALLGPIISWFVIRELSIKKEEKKIKFPKK